MKTHIKKWRKRQLFHSRADGYAAPDPSHPNGSKFCDQQKVFDDLGVGILKNAWEGYNTSLFAYGQTGSGKSWSVFGYGINKGGLQNINFMN